MDAEVVENGLREFGTAGRPGWRVSDAARPAIEPLRARVRTALPPSATAGDVDDCLEEMVRKAVDRLVRTDSEGPGPKGRRGRAARIYFAFEPESVDEPITERRKRMTEYLGLKPASHKSVPNHEQQLVRLVATWLEWPASTPRPNQLKAEEFSIGGLRNPWVAACFAERGTPIAPENIEITAIDEPRSYHPLVEDLAHRFERSVASRKEGHRPVNNKCLSLQSFDATGRTENAENLRLRLTVVPTHYFVSRVTNWNLDAPLDIDGVATTQRKRWAAEADLRSGVAAELGNVWGTIYSVVSTDGWLLLPMRGKTEVEPLCFGPSVGEEALWAKDVTPRGNCIVNQLAARAMHEELGFTLRARDELEWLEFGANTMCSRHALIGLVRPPLTKDELGSRIAANAQDGGFEIGQAYWVRFHPKSVAAFMTVPGRRFSPYSIAATLRSLIYVYGWDETEAAFAGADVDVVRDPLILPDLQPNI